MAAGLGKKHPEGKSRVPRAQLFKEVWWHVPWKILLIKFIQYKRHFCAL